METLTINRLIEESPVSIALLDDSFRFQNCSELWREQFCPNYALIEGKSFFEVMSDIPSELHEILPKCLQGSSSVNNGQKYLSDMGTYRWLKWKISPHKAADGTVQGIILIFEDVSQEAKEREIHKRALSVARIGGWEIDLLTNQIYWTDITKEIHEVPQDFVPNLEEGINFYKEGRHRDTITQLVGKAMKDGIPWDVKLIIVTAKGNERWVRALGNVEMLDGKCVRIFGTFQDINDEKLMELKFNEISNRLSIATSGTKIGIWELNIEKNEIIWDSNMYKLYGVSPKSFDPNNFSHWEGIMNPEALTKLNKTHEEALSGKNDYETEFKIRWPNGDERHISAKAVIVKNGNGKPSKMIGTNIDITELSRTRLLLEKSEESLQGAFEKSNVGMALVGLTGKWIKVNKKLCDNLGYTEEELKRTTFQDITHPEDLRSDLKLLQEIVAGKRDSYRIEKRYYHKTGEIVYAILTVTSVRNIEGKLSHFISQVMDITTRIKAEQELKRLLEITRQQKDSLLNFAHIVSHNLRSHATNLSMLTGFLEGEKDETEIGEIHSMLNDASESLNETVLHLNDVVQLKVGASEKLVPVNLYKTLKTVKKNLSVLLQEKNVECDLQMPKDLRVKGIPAYIDSIFLNLITNSIKYSSPERRPTIKITTEITDPNVIVSFSDNGLGINMKRHGKKIFGMYKTFHRNKDAKGIGLFITKNQIESMNGHIEVESEVNVGTTFKLFFDNNLTIE